MAMWEAAALLRHSDYAERDSWEQTRLLAFIVAQAHSSKKLSMDDLMRFPWDKEQSNDDEEQKSMSNDDIARVMAELSPYINKATE